MITRLKLNIGQRIIHYSLVFIFMIPALSSIFFIIEDVLGLYKGKADVEGWYSSAMFFSIIILLLFFIQYRRLYFKKIEISFTEKQFKEAVKRTSEQLDWYIIKNNRKIFQASRDFMIGSIMGELITIVKGEEYMLINSICDPNKWTNIFSIRRNKENVNVFLKNLKDSINEIPDVHKVKVKENEWSLKRMLIRIVLYPICLFLIFVGIMMIYHNISFRNMLSGVGLIFLCLIVLFADLKLWMKYKKK